MRRPTTRQIAIPLVVLMVALAGCSGGGGGDGSNGATATPTATEDPGGDDVDPTATETTTETATQTQTPTSTGGGDTATPTESADPTATPTESTTTDGGGSDGVEHGAALREAGSYTLQLNLTLVTTSSDGVSTSRLNGVQKTNLATGERYGEFSGTTASGTIEYYIPPDSDVAYQHFSGQTREVSPDQAFFLEFTGIADPDSGMNDQLVTNFSRYGEAGTVSTSLGPATRYVIDSVDQLPQSTMSQYEEVLSVEAELLVDQDTGVISRFQYEYVVVQEGEEITLDGLIELTDVGSTTIETPEWAP